MKEYLYDYIEMIDKLLNDNRKVSNEIIEDHLIKISFFQHERIIHLLVTIFYVIMFLMFSILGFLYWIFFIIAFILLIFSICYIIHYFNLENGVQYLYKQYDRMIEK